MWVLVWCLSVEVELAISVRSELPPSESTLIESKRLTYGSATDILLQGTGSGRSSTSSMPR